MLMEYLVYTFLVTNITVMLLFFVMSYFKCKFSNELETEQSA